MTSSFEEAIVASERFQLILAQLAKDAVIADLPSVHMLDDQVEEIDWPFAILSASALTRAKGRSAQEAALRVAQSAILSDTDLSIRDAAIVLLERLGNRPALELAERRGLVQSSNLSTIPPPLSFEIIRRRLELTISGNGRPPIEANTFQRDFWTEATHVKWLSVSAPTSAGKSFIVKRWIESEMDRHVAYRAIYVVPTRALIEEVSHDLISDFAGRVQIHTMPWDAEIGESQKEIYVLTQERFHLLQQRFAAMRIDFVFVDEAQKFDDGARGVLLQQVLDEAVRRNPTSQVIFASPLTTNPESLLRGAPQGLETGFLNSESVTVNQNLLTATQVFGKPREWLLNIAVEGIMESCGGFVLAARPTPVSKRLPLIAVALGTDRPGNVVYVNGAASAEKTAKQIYEALGTSADISNDPDISALRELSRTAVHPQYGLDEVLRRGVAFHYGNMPLLLKNEIERLFKIEKLRYLVCTSTLLEGVNLPCKNLFVRGPRKGVGHPMTPADFWNLAGRAGRWGKEFQGNIVCVDTNDPEQWPEPPSQRVKQPISRATDRIMGELAELMTYIRSGGPLALARENNLLEPVFSLLASRVSRGQSLSSIVGLEIQEDESSELQALIEEALAAVTFPSELVERHAGISPLSMQRLLNTFSSVPNLTNLLLPPPESNNAAQSYASAFALISSQLGGDWGPAGRQFNLAILITQWMRGMPLSRLIADRLAYARSVGNANIPAVIRGTMNDVEQIARFQAPKYLACYQDILLSFAESVGLPISADATFDVSMMLELGVSRPTEVSLMALGLSRTTTIGISEFIVEDSFTPNEALHWLRQQDIEALALPTLVRREIQQRLDAEVVPED